MSGLHLDEGNLPSEKVSSSESVRVLRFLKPTNLWIRLERQQGQFPQSFHDSVKILFRQMNKFQNNINFRKFGSVVIFIRTRLTEK